MNTLVWSAAAVGCLVAGIFHVVWPSWLRDWEDRWGFFFNFGPTSRFANAMRYRSAFILFVGAVGSVYFVFHP